MEAAGQWDLAEPLTAAIGQSVVLARGPKVRGAIRAAGLRETWSPESESSAEVLEHLLADYDLAGKRIAVQLHGDPLTEFIAALRQAGAEVIEVPVYRWVPPEDPGPLHRLIEAVVAGAVDAVAFTSAPAAANFLATADQQGQGEAVRAALGGPVLAACVGPVTAAPLVQAGHPRRPAHPEPPRRPGQGDRRATPPPQRAPGPGRAPRTLKLRSAVPAAAAGRKGRRRSGRSAGRP